MPSGSAAGVVEGAGVTDEGGVGEVEARAVVEGEIDAPTGELFAPPLSKKTASTAAAATVASDATPARSPPGRRHHGAPNRPEAMAVRTRGPRSLGAAATGSSPSS